MTEFLKHFDIIYYKNKYPELKNFSKHKITNHFLNIGLREKRIFNKKLENFNLIEYKYRFPECNDMAYIKVCNHYLDIGINKKEIHSIIKESNNNNNNNNNVYDILVILPTYNRSDNIENIINQMNNQSYKKFILLIIDDGSEYNHIEKFKQIEKKYKNNSNIIFNKNIKNLNIANTLNKGIKYFIENINFNYLTWISDDNVYHSNFLEVLKKDNEYFKYSYFNFINKLRNTNNIIDVEYNIDKLTNNFKGCASFMWARCAIEKIGFYNSYIHGCEDFEYLLRTFNNDEQRCKIEKKSLMNYYLNNDSLFIKDNINIMNLKSNIEKIYKYLRNNNDNFIYYSKTEYKLLFQRPHQIMRFFNKSFNKIFIGQIDNVEFEEKYNLLIIPYKLKECLFNFINDNNKYIYYTDTRLYDEINYKSEFIKIYDLIDAPINEFEVLKPNLEKSVKKSHYVIYSHPKLINFLKEIDENKEYTYISNACDYEHFSKAKNKIGKRPQDFPQTDKPILGYYGAFAKWIDYDTIKQYADKEDYHLVLIGGINKNPTYNIRFEHKNITWLDHKSYDELPYYLSWFDKCFLPFKDCELTKYVNPCKLWEYMASEKEIIKYNVNMYVNEIVKYDDVCDKLSQILKYNFSNINTISNFIEKVLPLYKNVWIQYYSIPYYTNLYQRPQHICNNISKLNFLSIYLNVNNNNKSEKIIYDNNVWILENIDFEKIPYFNYQNIYISVYSTISYPFREIYKIKHIKNIYLIYEYIDEIDSKISGSNYSTKIQLENKYFAFNNFDILIASSNKLFEELPKNKNSILINNGCDINHFQNKINKTYVDNEYKNQYNKLLSFKNKFKIILGYFGAIAPWLDYKIINDIIEKRNEIGFVFIGPDYLNQIQNIIIKENVLILGPIDYTILPYFAFKFDICFIPFEDGDIAKTTSPLKLFEYCSMKKPVICNKSMYECIKYNEVLRYNSIQSLNDCINESITLIKDENYLNKLFDIAIENTWEKLCKKITDYLIK